MSTDSPSSELEHDQARILYLLGAYPRWSETFIRQDLVLLQQLGLPLLPAAIFAGDTERRADWPDVTILSDSELTVSGKGNVSNSGGHVGTRGRLSLFRHRQLYRRFADFACAGRVTHLHAEFADLPSVFVVSLARELGLSYSIGVHARDVQACKYNLSALLGSANFVTACNASARDAVYSCCPELVGRVRLIHHGVRLNEWQFAKRPAEHGSVLKLLFVGRFVEKKGVQFLLQAAFAARNAGLNLQLTLVGGGPAEVRLRELVADLQLDAVVQWAGIIPRLAVRRAMTAADCLVVPSVVAGDGDVDGIPNVVVEAMATGLPVVATRVGGLAEVVSDDTAWVCQAASAEDITVRLNEIQRKRSEVHEKCTKARRLIEAEFDAVALARRRTALFQSCLPEITGIL